MRVELPQRGLHLEYESHGDPAHPAVMLIMGLGMQLLAWPAALIDALVAERLRVVVFDNRDIGLSGTGPLPPHYTPVRRAVLLSLLRLPFTPPYRLADMAQDTLALADALGIERMHLVGVSMGGMIGQTMAARAPMRVLSLVSAMSAAGPQVTPLPHTSLLPVLLRRPGSGASFERRVDYHVELMTALGALTDPEEIASLRSRTERAHQRGYSNAGVLRQYLAILADPDRSEEVRCIRCPTLIVHGKDDPLVPVGAALHLQRLLPDARMELVPKLGHYLPPWFIAPFAQMIIRHVRGAAPDAAA